MRNLTTEDFLDALKAAVNVIESKLQKEKIEKEQEENERILYNMNPSLYQTKKLIQAFRDKNPTFESLFGDIDKENLFVKETIKAINKDIENFMANKIEDEIVYDSDAWVVFEKAAREYAERMNTLQEEDAKRDEKDNI